MVGAPNPGDFHSGLGGCSQYLFFHLLSGEEGLGYLFRRRYGLSNPASVVRLVVSPNREKGRS